MKKLSPFKYFNPFYTSDKNEFFGRSDETVQLHNLTKQSYLTVLSGLSGSGKTSLINAGLIPKMGIGHNAIISIHKKKDEKLTESLMQVLRTEWNLDTSSLQRYLKEQIKLISLFRTKEDLSDQLNILEEEIDRYDFLPENEKANSAIQEKKELFTSQSKQHKDTLSQIGEIKGHRNQLIDDIRHLFKTAIKGKFKGKSPLIIFDQFEEIFFFEVIDGEADENSEVKEFGILLELLIKNNIPINCVLSLRQEQFGYLDRLHDYLPNIFEKNIRISRPSRHTVYEIITKSFNKFNITCNDELKYKIIENIKPDSSKEVYHLPFLQVYMHELYLKTLAREKKVYDPENLPEIEVKAEDFNELNNIRDLIMGIISDCDDDLLQNTGIKKSKSLRNTKFLATTVLKLFVSDHKTKIRFHFGDIETLKSASNSVNANQADNFFSQDYFGLDRGAIDRLWNENVNEIDKKRLVGKIISLLLSKNLLFLNHKEKYIELAHDTLAEIIHYIPVEEDILAHYKRNFDSAFLLYSKDLSEDVKNPSMLSEDLVNRIGNDIEYIIQDDKSNYEQKRAFWKKSFDFHEGKKLRRRRRARNWIVALAVFSTIAVGALIWGYSQYQNVIKEKEKTETQKVQKENISQTFKNVGNAYNAGKNDLTEAYDILKQFEKKEGFSLNDIEALLGKEKEANVREVYRRDLINNVHKRPYYYMNIEVDKSDHVISTKSRPYSAEGDIILLYAETRNELKRYKFDLIGRSAVGDTLTLDTKITAFEPYKSDETQRVIYSCDKGLFDVDESFSDTIYFKGANQANLKEIDKISEDKFVGIAENGKSLVLINKQNKYVSWLPLHSKFKNSFSDSILAKRNQITKIYKIKKTKNDELVFIAKAGNTNWLFKWDFSNGIENSQLNSAQLSSVNFEDFKSLIVNEKTLFIADKRSIYEISLEELNSPADMSQSIFPYTPKIVSRHNEEITSIDYSDEYFLIGSVDKTASLTFDPSKSRPYDDIKIKEFIGHTDEILNVSFLNNSNKDKKFLLTSGKDGTIKIWDITKIELDSIRLPRVHSITKLMSKNNKLYASFDVLLDRSGHFDNKNSTYILEINDTLGTENKYYYRGNSSPKNPKYLNTFDFDGNEIVAETGRGLEIRNAQTKGSKVKSVFMNLNISPQPIKPRYGINNICIRDSFLVAATDTGVYFIKHFKETKHSTRSKAIQENWLICTTPINSVDIHPTKSLVLATANNGHLYLWDLTNGQVDTLNYHTDGANDACFSSSGKYIISGSDDNTVALWQVNENLETSYSLIQVIKAHTSDIEDVAFSGDTLIASASNDHTVLLHKLNTGNHSTTQIPSLIYHNYGIRAVAFGEQEGIIYSGDKKGFIKKWNWKKFEEEIEKRRDKSGKN